MASVRSGNFETLVPLILRLPVGQHCDVTHAGGLDMQANTQDHVSRLLTLFPGVIWKKTWQDSCEWWNYDGEYQGIPIHIYAVKEAPRTCTAITEERDVEEQVPVAFETRTVRRHVIVGWDCGEPKRLERVS